MLTEEEKARRIKTNKRIIKYALIIFFAIIIIAKLGTLIDRGTPEQHTSKTIRINRLPDCSQAKPYKIIDSYHFNIPGRQRVSISITSNASTSEERAQTAIKAAIDLQKQSQAAVATVSLIPSKAFIGKGYDLAHARYAPDNKGMDGTGNWTWQVDSTGEQLTPLQVKCAALYANYGDKFNKPDGSFDENAMKEFISRKLNIPVAQVDIKTVAAGPYKIHYPL